MKCPDCEGSGEVGYLKRPEFVKGVNLGDLTKAFEALFTGLEDDTRVKDTQTFLLETLVDTMFEDSGAFWDYVHQYGREW